MYGLWTEHYRTVYPSTLYVTLKGIPNEASEPTGDYFDPSVIQPSGRSMIPTLGEVGTLTLEQLLHKQQNAKRYNIIHVHVKLRIVPSITVTVYVYLIRVVSATLIKDGYIYSIPSTVLPVLLPPSHLLYCQRQPVSLVRHVIFLPLTQQLYVTLRWAVLLWRSLTLVDYWLQAVLTMRMCTH